MHSSASARPFVLHVTSVRLAGTVDPSVEDAHAHPTPSAATAW